MSASLREEILDIIRPESGVKWDAESFTGHQIRARLIENRKNWKNKNWRWWLLRFLSGDDTAESVIVDAMYHMWSYDHTIALVNGGLNIRFTLNTQVSWVKDKYTPEVYYSRKMI